MMSVSSKHALGSIPNDIIAHALSFLPPKDVVFAGRSNNKFRDVCERHALWREFCVRLWSDKVYVPPEFREMLLAKRGKYAYFKSLIDAKRNHITEKELTDAVWRFRFKKCAGEHWVEMDAYWRGEGPTTVKFNADKSVVRSTSTFQRSWTFVDRTRCRQGPRGSFIRTVRADGGTVPTYVVGRHSNWGFIMESCWAVYTSFDMPAPGEDPELEDDNLSVDSDEQIDEVLSYNFGLSHHQVLAAFDTAAADDDEDSDTDGQSPNPAAIGGALNYLLHSTGAGVGNNGPVLPIAAGGNTAGGNSDSDSDESDDNVGSLGDLMSDDSDTE